MAEGLTLLAGPYVAASPWIIGFAGQAPLTMNNLIAGIAVALLAVGFTSADGRTHGTAFVAPPLGVWMIISPWVVAGVAASTGMIVSNVIVCVLGLGITAIGTKRYLREGR